MSDDLYKKLRSITSLRKAWQKVKANGKKSKSKLTQQEIREFDSEIDKHLNRIGKQLRANRYKFAKSFGLPLSKGKNKGVRPVVISPVENRIVQRAILDVMQNFEPLKCYFVVPTSFGAIEGKGEVVY